MELTKFDKADPESKSVLSLQIGIFVSIVIVLSSFASSGNITNDNQCGQMVVSEINEDEFPDINQAEVNLLKPSSPLADDEISNILNVETKVIEDLVCADPELIKDAKARKNPNSNQKNPTEAIFAMVEIMPEFPGGDLALHKFIARAIRYPTISLENGIQGRVYVNFVVDKDGGISNAKIARGVDPLIDKEALRVIMNLPKWRPGMQQGKAVRVSYTVLINFQLQ